MHFVFECAIAPLGVHFLYCSMPYSNNARHCPRPHSDTKIQNHKIILLILRQNIYEKKHVHLTWPKINYYCIYESRPEPKNKKHSPINQTQLGHTHNLTTTTAIWWPPTQPNKILKKIKTNKNLIESINDCDLVYKCETWHTPGPHIKNKNNQNNNLTPNEPLKSKQSTQKHDRKIYKRNQFANPNRI